MESRTAATRVPDPDAAEFVRFCYRRRRVGWPELYDEMCAVASRGLYRGFGSDDLAGMGIGFTLFDMPALAALAHRVVAEEQALRRPMTVTIAASTSEAASVEAAVVPEAAAAPVVHAAHAAAAPVVHAAHAAAAPTVTAAPTVPVRPEVTADAPSGVSVRFVPVPSGA